MDRVASTFCVHEDKACRCKHGDNFGRVGNDYICLMITSGPDRLSGHCHDIKLYPLVDVEKVNSREFENEVH